MQRILSGYAVTVPVGHTVFSWPVTLWATACNCGRCQPRGGQGPAVVPTLFMCPAVPSIYPCKIDVRSVLVVGII